MNEQSPLASKLVRPSRQMVRRSLILMCLFAVAGVVTWYVVALQSRGPNTAEIAKHFAVILDDASTAKEVDRSVAYFSTERTDWKIEFATREFAKSLPKDLGWIEYRDFRGSREIPKPYRRTCLLWRVMRNHRHGGSPGTALQRLAPQPDFAETTWTLVRYLPNSPWDVAHFKGSLLHGLMEERGLKLGQTELRIPVKNVPAENPEIVRLTGQLIDDTPDESREHAYFLALQFGDYIGVDFRSDAQSPEFQGPNGLNRQLFFSSSAKKAAEWWRSRRHEQRTDEGMEQAR